MQAEKWGVCVEEQFEGALAWSPASCEGAAGGGSLGGAGSPGVSEAGAGSHFADVAAADLGREMKPC